MRLAAYARATSRVCCVWNDTDISEILDAIDSSGWTLLVDACGRNTPPNAPMTPLPMCLDQLDAPLPRAPLFLGTGYITSANTAVRSMQRHNPRAQIVVPAQTATADINYPCAAFVVQAPNVSIEFFDFDISACVSIQVQMRALGGVSSADIWARATPIIAQDTSNDLRLLHLSELTLAQGGDAVARILPHSADATVNVDGAQFVNVVGANNASRPVRPPGSADNVFAVLIAPASGTVTATGTFVLGFGGELVISGSSTSTLGQWLGVQVGVQPPSCTPKEPQNCPVCKEPHPDTATSAAIYVLTALTLSGIIAYLVYVIFERVARLEKGKKHD